MWYWEHVKLSLAVEAAKVNTHTQLSHFPVYKQDWRTIGQHARMYLALFQHFSDVLLHNIAFVHAKLILLMVWWQCVFIDNVNGVVKRVMCS